MPGFATPAVLLLLPLAALLAWRWAVGRRPALRYSSLELVADLPRGRATRAIRGGAILRGLALAALIVAVAGPRTPDETTRLPADGIAIVLALDVSGSMAESFATDPPTTRLDAAKQTFRLFVAGGPGPDGTTFAGRPTDQIGLVAFAAVPTTVCPLTLSHDALLALADAQTPRDGADAGTNIGDAIAEGVHRLDAAGPRRKVLILLSDGEHNIAKDGPDAALKPLAAGQLAHALGIPIYTIDCGGDAGTDPEHVEQRAAGRRVLRELAELTDGRSFTATDAGELRAVYEQIDKLERTPAAGYRYRRYHEFYPWAALLAGGLFALVLVLDATVWRRGP